MPSSTPHDFLSKVPFFKDLLKSDHEKILATAIKKKFSQDQFVYFEGDPSVGLYIVESGWIKVSKTSANGREQVIRFVTSNEPINALGLFLDVPNPATAIALEPSTVWIIKQEVAQKLIDDNPIMAKSIIKTLATRIQYLLSLVEDLSLRSVESRLARLLITQASEDTIHRKQWATQTEIAARLGTVTDVLSRVLRKLSEEEIIKVSRHQIKILNLKALEEKADIKL